MNKRISTTDDHAEKSLKIWDIKALYENLSSQSFGKRLTQIRDLSLDSIYELESCLHKLKPHQLPLDSQMFELFVRRLLRRERAQKASVIDARIQISYQRLKGWLIEGERLERVWNLPIEYLESLADKLEAAIRGSDTREPSLIVESVVYEHWKDCWDAERARLDETVPPAKMEVW